MPPTEPQPMQAAPLLLALPEPLLLAVLRLLAAADDPRSLFSAARTHSRLHQAAVAALSSVAVGAIKQQHALDSVLLYLGKHGQHVRSVDLSASDTCSVALHQLPPSLQLHSLQLFHLKLQLLPGAGCQGVLGPAAGLSALKQLRLKGCALLDSQEGLDTALARLPPGLEHLSIDGMYRVDSMATFPLSILQGLQQLTHLVLWGIQLQADDPATPMLQPLQALSRLVDLRLTPTHANSDGLPMLKLSASMLAGATGLTHLQLQHLDVEPGVLAGKTQLHHLVLLQFTAKAAWTVQLLSHLGPLQQLTRLDLCEYSHTDAAPPTAYSALTASSTLQRLCLSYCTLPAGVWQHVFPAGRQLPHLTSLEASCVRRPGGRYLTAPEGSRLVSCCPGLQCLDVQGLTHSAGVFAALVGLSALTKLCCSLTLGEALGEVCQLTGLRALDLSADSGTPGEVLLQTTQLRQLTRLEYWQQHAGPTYLHWSAKAPGDLPVWRQVLRHYLGHSDPAVAQAAAAALDA